MEYESNHRKLWIVHPYDEEYYDSFCFSVEGLLPNHGIICHDKIIFRCYCCRCCSSIFCGRNSLHFETNKHRKNPDKSWLELKRFQHFSSCAIFHFSTRFSLPVINKPFSFGGKKWMLLLWFALFVFRSKLWWMVMLLLLSRVATVFGPHKINNKPHTHVSAKLTVFTNAVALLSIKCIHCCPAYLRAQPNRCYVYSLMICRRKLPPTLKSYTAYEQMQIESSNSLTRV